MTTPKPFQLRTMNESHDLEERIVKLRRFRKTDDFAALPPEDQALLDSQVTAMQRLGDILTRRINRL